MLRYTPLESTAHSGQCTFFWVTEIYERLKMAELISCTCTAQHVFYM